MKKQSASSLLSSVSSLRSYLLSTGKSTVTAAIIERSIYDFSNWCEDQRIEAGFATYQEILSYMKNLQKRGLKQRTIQMHISHLGHYFQWIIERGIRTDHPVQGIEVKGVQRRYLYHIVPMTELEAVYSTFTKMDKPELRDLKLWEIQQHYTKKTRQVVYGLMIWQGLETGELKRLMIQDLKLREGTIYIAGTRRSNERTLKLQSVQIMDLMDYLHTVRPWVRRGNPKSTESLPEGRDKLFISRHGGEWGSNFVFGLLTYLSSQNPRITSLKQLHASVLVYWLKTNNLRQAQYMAGHRYVSSTEAYLINDLDDLQEDIIRFHPMG